MATLTHEAEYPCAFDLRLLEWERYSSMKEDSQVKTVPQGEPYTLWVKYRMALRIGEHVLYQSAKETTLVLQDIRRLIEQLLQLADGGKDKLAFDPIEPDFGLIIHRLTESNALVMTASVAEIRAETPTGATNKSTALSSLFDVNAWIDHSNQVDDFYGGYGPGLYFFVDAANIERFAFQLQAELNALGPYFTNEAGQ